MKVFDDPLEREIRSFSCCSLRGQDLDEFPLLNEFLGPYDYMFNEDSVNHHFVGTWICQSRKYRRRFAFALFEYTENHATMIDGLRPGDLLLIPDFKGRAVKTDRPFYLAWVLMFAAYWWCMETMGRIFVLVPGDCGPSDDVMTYLNFEQVGDLSPHYRHRFHLFVADNVVIEPYFQWMQNIGADWKT